MSQAQFDVVGIGNAIVDVIAKADDAFLARNQLNKGLMTLIDAKRADELYGKMGPGREISGGSCANTMAGVAALGGRAAYFGKVRDDQLGQVFRHDITAAPGVSPPSRISSQPIKRRPRPAKNCSSRRFSQVCSWASRVRPSALIRAWHFGHVFQRSRGASSPPM